MRIFPLIMFGSAALVGCGGDDSYDSVVPVSGAPDTTAVRRWLESFDHLGQTASVMGSAEVDTTRGVLSLPGETLPVIDAVDKVVLGAAAVESGFARGAEVSVTIGDEIIAPDGLDLRARDLVRVSGDIVTGAGGLVIAAGNRIEILGKLRSEGPIELVITQPGGLILISGSIEVTGGPALEAGPALLIRGRGGVSVRGAIRLGGEGARLEANIYERFGIDALGASISTGVDGEVSISSAGPLEIQNGARIEDLGAWTLMTGALDLAETTQLAVGRLSVIASRTVSLAPRASLAAGGGELSILADQVALGAESSVVGTESTSIRLEAASGARMGARARIGGSGYGTCSVVARLGGTFLGLGNAALWPDADPTTCPESQTRAVLVAEALEGIAPDLIADVVDLQTGADLDIRLPTTGGPVSSGRWQSKPFPVDADARPRLVALNAEVPTGARVRVGLAESSGPDAPGSDFIFADDDPAAWLDAFPGATWLVLQVELEGRRFDVPSVDHLAIEW